VLGPPELSRSPPRTPSETAAYRSHHQWDDEIFDREGALELFDTIGSQDKRMHVHPGKHGAFPREAADATREFLAARLCRRS